MTLAMKSFLWVVGAFWSWPTHVFSAGTIAWPAGWIDPDFALHLSIVGILLLFSTTRLAGRAPASLLPNQKAWDRCFSRYSNCSILLADSDAL